MKRLITLIVVLTAVLNVMAQNVVMKVQGHERPDVQVSKVPLRAVAEEDKDFTFDDITFWVGEGEKRAALVIDWYDDKGGTLVWGFRWDGSATGYDMVCAIANADPRFLFFTHYTGPMGNTIAGFGYDLNKSGGQYLIFDGDTDSPYYPVNGIVTTTAYDYDFWTNDDPDDHWQSGWYEGYWSYQVKDRQEDDFFYSGLGASSRQLQDGSWDGWGYQDGWDSWSGVVPRAPYTAAPSPFPDYDSYWSEMGKDSSHMAIIDTYTARHADEFSEKWKIELSSSWMNGGQPLIVNGNIYLAINNKVMMIDAESGEIIKENTLAGQCGYFSMIAYGEGKIFVPMNNGLLQAFNAETLESVWKTQTKSGYQHLCPVVYHDGYVYTGMWRGGSPTLGVYYCVSAKDEEGWSTEEIKEYTWVSDDTGFYWTGGTVVDDYILFGGDSGIMQSRDRKTGELIDTYQIAPELSVSTIRCGSSYDETTRMLYFTGKETKTLYGIKINTDGTFDKDNVKSAEVAGQTTTTPTVFNGRVYVTSGTMTSGGGMDVLDAITLEPIYTIDLGGISQSTPLLTTAYATSANNNTVYLYVCLNNATGSVVCVKDFEGNTEPIVQFSYIPSSTQYCTHSLVADENGVIYYKNDAKYLFALETTPSTDAISVSLNEESINLNANQTFQLEATVNPENATNKNVIWASSDESIATVDATGLVTGVDNGSATITVTTVDGGFMDECEVNVTVPVYAVVLDIYDADLLIGETLQLTATVKPDNATNKNVTWESRNEAVATVSEDGLIKATGKGSTIIVVKADGGKYTSQCVVNVTVPVTDVALNKSTLTLVEGTNETLIATINPDNANNQNVSWASSNEAVATVNGGLVTAIAEGETVITVTTEDGGKTATCAVTVERAPIPVTSVALNKTTLTMSIGDTDTLIATVNPDDADNKNVSWTSNNEAVATVDANGLVTAIANGNATITVTTEDGGKTATCTVTVEGVAINDIQNDVQVYCYNNNLILKGCAGYDFVLYSINGTQIGRIAVTGDDYSHQLSVPAGIYVVRGNNGQQSIEKKIVVKR